MLAFFQSPAGRWLVILVLLLIALAAAFAKGVEWEQGREATRLLEEERAYSKRLAESIERDRLLHGLIADEMAKGRADAEKERDRFKRELANVPRGTLVTTCPTAPQQAGVVAPPPRLTAAACRLWNSALSSGTTAAERAGWLAGDDPCSGEVEVEDALGNVQRNAELLGQCRTREALTHEWLKSRGFTVAPEGESHGR